MQTQKDGSVLLSLYVQPRAGKNELAGVHDGALKIRLTAPPVDGRANKAAVAFLSKTLRVSKSALVLTSGLKNRRKQIKISGLDEQSVRRLFSIS